MLPHRFASIPIALSLGLSLAACGGGSGTIASAPAPVASPAPAPSPSPSPSPAPNTRTALVDPVVTTYPQQPVAVVGGPTLSSLSAPITLPLLQTAITMPGGFSGDQATTSQGATLNLDPAKGRRGLTLNNPAIDIVDATATKDATTYGGYIGFGAPISGGRFLQTNVQTLDYTAYGYWLVMASVTGGIDAWNGGAFVGGLATPSGAIPTTGTASYSGAVTGLYDEVPAIGGSQYGSVALLYGNVHLSADFGLRSVAGTMTQLKLGSDSLILPPMPDLAFTAALDPAANLFAGKVAVSNPASGSSAFAADASGTVRGRFFGPAADEVGGVWTLSDTAHRLIGSFGARKD